MVGNLLLRGMLAGLLAGIICFGFLKIAGEPAVDRAIAFEAKMDEAKEVNAKATMRDMAVSAEAQPGELVSRPVQAGIGLFTGVAVYSTAFGGLFAIVFALVYGRMGKLGARATSAMLASLGFVSVYLIPGLKYPANPPSVGEPETIGTRTALYFAMIAISLAGMIGASMLHKRLLVWLSQWEAAIAAGTIYFAAVAAVALLLPVINEVPEQFPATVLWQFRVASIGSQLLMWTTIGLVFGKAAEGLLQAATPRFGAAVRA